MTPERHAYGDTFRPAAALMRIARRLVSFRKVCHFKSVPLFVRNASESGVSMTAGDGPASKVPRTQEVLQVKKLSEHAVLPVRGSPGAAGYDLAAAHDTVIPARGKGLVPTDLSIAIPWGTYARVAPRSGLALKKFIDTGAGVIDYDYRGPVGVVLFNHSDEHDLLLSLISLAKPNDRYAALHPRLQDFEIKRGDRVAQLILEKIVMADVMEVQELDSTERGAGGFGSTGGHDAVAK